MSKIAHFFIFIALATFSFNTFAKPPIGVATPIGLGIVPPVQFPHSKFVVKGIRLSAIYGDNREVAGLDLGLVGNTTDQDFTGLAVSGLFNWNQGSATVIGAQLAGIMNVNEERGEVYGIQAAIFANQSPFMDVYGVQIGIYNRAQAVYGLQIGLFNYTKNLYGLQIGLANYNEGGPFRVSPLINFGF